MKAVLERVSGAEVRVAGESVGKIGQGLLVYAAVERGDTVDDCGRLARKILNFRIFEDSQGKMNLAVTDLRGGILVVSEFTLAADARKGTRPSFDAAEIPERARELLARFVAFLKESGLVVGEGVFGAHMEVAATNDGPVTFVLES